MDILKKIIKIIFMSVFLFFISLIVIAIFQHYFGELGKIISAIICGLINGIIVYIMLD